MLNLSEYHYFKGSLLATCAGDISESVLHTLVKFLQEIKPFEDTISYNKKKKKEEGSTIRGAITFESQQREGT